MCDEQQEPIPGSMEQCNYTEQTTKSFTHAVSSSCVHSHAPPGPPVYGSLAYTDGHRSPAIYQLVRSCPRTVQVEIRYAPARALEEIYWSGVVLGAPCRRLLTYPGLAQVRLESGLMGSRMPACSCVWPMKHAEISVSSSCDHRKRPSNNYCRNTRYVCGKSSRA